MEVLVAALLDLICTPNILRIQTLLEQGQPLLLLNITNSISNTINQQCNKTHK
jgi:hypothetical protein